MSKLAHSNQATMEEIERRAEDMRDEPNDHASLMNQYPTAAALLEKHDREPFSFLAHELWAIECGKCFNCGDCVDYDEEWKCQTCDQRLLKERPR